MLADHTGTGHSRIAALDFTKGVLVLLMVIYHVLNYLDYGSLPHEYLGFVPASFIMIAGFLIARVYAGRTKADFSATAHRLGERAIKLLLIFTVLNVGARLLWSRNHYGVELGLAAFFRDWESVYLKGNATGVAFDVLVPIGYTLLVAIALLKLAQNRRAILYALTLALFLACALMESLGSGVNTLNLISAGVLGVSLGTLRSGQVERFATPARVLGILGVTYVGIWSSGMDNYAVQILSTVAWLAVFYWMGHVSSSDRWWFEQVCLLGRYSLIGYIAQILYLQGTRALVVMTPQATVGEATAVAVMIGLATWATIFCLEEARRKSAVIDRAYRAVFA